YCAHYGTNHAANPSFILAYSTMGTINYMDVSGSTPVITKTVAAGASDLAVLPDQAHFISDSIAGCPAPNDYCFTEFNLLDLSMDGNNYAAARFPDAVDASYPGGSIGQPKILGGVNGLTGQSGVDAFAYPIGDISQQLLGTVSFGQAGTPDRGVALSPDGKTAYVVVEGVSCFYACEELNLLPLPVLPADGSPSEPTHVSATACVGA